MKQCRTCKEIKQESEFYTRTDTGRLRGECKICFNIKGSVLRKRHYHKDEEYRQRGRDRMKRWRENPDNKLKESKMAFDLYSKTGKRKEYNKNYIKNISDSYVIGILTIGERKKGLNKLLKKYPELIEAKRQLLKTKRYINEDLHTL